MRELNLLFVHSKAIGYGVLGVNLAREIQKAGVTVWDDLPGQDVPEWHAEAEHLANLRGRSSGIAKTAAWISVPTHARGWYKNQSPVMFSMWESTTLPEGFRETLHEFDTVIVPSQQNVELFSQYHDNVQLCLLGVDPSVWHYTARRPPGAFFDYLIAGSGPRKGTDLAYAAFNKVWGRNGSWPREGPIPRLVMKTPRGEDFYHERVQIIGGRISAEAEVDLFESAHCYVQPSRGEGFGLMPLQAIAQGCPTILSDAHGHASFAHLGLGISCKPSPAAYFIYGDAGEWWEPSLDELCDRMKWVYENWDEVVETAKFNAQQVVTQRFTWADCAKRFLDIIGEDRLGRLESPEGWYEPTLQRFEVITNRDWHCDVAGTSYQFVKGKSYYDVADVKRILYEAGLLDPACLNYDGNGLLPQQMETLGKYTATHEHCALCGQELGTKTTRAEALFDAGNRQ